ncbi:unnamed protein product [Closterium sp. NIES-54]
MVTTTTPGGQRVSICTCTQTGRQLATFTRRPGSSLYTLATEPPQEVVSALVSASGQVAPPCSCRLLSHQTFLWHHRLGHPSLPRLRGMHSRLLRFSTDLPVLRLHSDRGGEFFSNLLRDFCRGEGILQSFTLPASPQQNGIAEHRIGLVMEVARTSMIHADAPIFCGSLRPPPPLGSCSSGVSQVDALPSFAPVEVAVGSGAARGAVSGGAATGGADPGVAESEGAGSGGAEPRCEEPGGAEPAGVEPWGAELEGVESGGAEPLGAAFFGGRAAGAGGTGVTTGAGGTGGTAATGPGGARTRGTRAAGSGGVGGAC